MPCREGDVLHAGPFCQASQRPGIEVLGGKPFRKLPVLCLGHGAVMEDPLAAFEERIEAPVDEHAEGHLFEAGNSRFGNGYGQPDHPLSMIGAKENAGKSPHPGVITLISYCFGRSASSSGGVGAASTLRRERGKKLARPPALSLSFKPLCATVLTHPEPGSTRAVAEGGRLPVARGSGRRKRRTFEPHVHLPLQTQGALPSYGPSRCVPPHTIPLRTAQMARLTRLGRSSFASRLVTWAFTVRSVIPKSSAISLFSSPCPT